MSGHDDDYEVGYGKPPRSGQFKPGQSGNPRGRKPGSKGVSTHVREALEAKVTINQGGKRQSVSKLKAACIQLANKAAAGDPRALKEMVAMMAATESLDAAKAAGVEQTTAERHRALEQVYRTLHAELKMDGSDDDKA